MSEYGKGQQSIFFDSDGNKLFSITAETSEWLFCSHFWAEINELHGTNFQQYEEDTMSPLIALTVSKLLENRIARLLKRNAGEIIFARGWDEFGSPLIVETETSILVEELKAAVLFFNTTAANEVDFVASL